MALTRACTRMVVAAVVLIAVYLMPSAAWAHGSHAHHGPQAVSIGSHHQVDAGVSVAAASKAALSAPTAQPVVKLARRSGGSDAAGDPNCVGGCCGMGSGCCPAAMAVAADPPSILRSGAPIRAWPGPFANSSADLEALPKPPKVLV